MVKSVKVKSIVNKNGVYIISIPAGRDVTVYKTGYTQDIRGDVEKFINAFRKPVTIHAFKHYCTINRSLRRAINMSDNNPYSVVYKKDIFKLMKNVDKSIDMNDWTTSNPKLCSMNRDIPVLGTHGVIVTFPQELDFVSKKEFN